MLSQHDCRNVTTTHKQTPSASCIAHTRHCALWNTKLCLNATHILEIPRCCLCIAPTAGTQICTTAPMTSVAGLSVKGNEGTENRKPGWEMSPTGICRSATPCTPKWVRSMNTRDGHQVSGQQQGLPGGNGETENRNGRGIWLMAAPGSVAFPVIVQNTTL